jgi:hypothetical protein
MRQIRLFQSCYETAFCRAEVVTVVSLGIVLEFRVIVIMRNSK